MRMVFFFKNKVIFYLASRYATYAVQFITSIVIAAKLGPYYMGIWGFILLLLQYFQQFHFGISNSFNVLYVHHKEDKNECDKYIWNSLVLISYLSIIVLLVYFVYVIRGGSWVEKYNADKYIVWVCLIAILQYFVTFFINLFRVKNQLNFVTFCQSIIVFLNFVCIFFFDGDKLIKWLVAGYVIGNILCAILALISGTIPKFKKTMIRYDYQKEIIRKGLYLFFYNSCFYFIIISIRTIISGKYSIEEFGLFTFSFTLAHAILLILEALSFVIFPKLINLLSSNNREDINKTISLLRDSYISSAHLLIYLALVAFPYFLLALPKYKSCVVSMNLIALTIIMNLNSTGYIEYLIAQNKEKLTALLAAGALIINCVLGLLFANVFHVGFSYVIIATMITYLVYTFLIYGVGRKMLRQQGNFITNYFPLRLLVPYLASLIVIFMGSHLMFVPLFIFILLNYSCLKKTTSLVKTLFLKPEVVNL